MYVMCIGSEDTKKLQTRAIQDQDNKKIFYYDNLIVKMGRGALNPSAMLGSLEGEESRGE